MQVKTFIGPSPQAVLAQIKQELGPEAIILSSRDVSQDGKRLHEVVAGIDRPLPGSVPGFISGAEGPSPALQEQAGPAGWSEWHKEWSRFKEHLYGLMRPSIQWNLLSPRQRVALEYLQKEGLNDDLVLDIYNTLTRDPEASILESLAAIAPVRPWNADNWKEIVHVIAGPYGAGKTTSLIRMALALQKDIPALKVAVINADCARGTGRLVLRHWAELSDFMYLEAHDADTMKRALRSANAADVIFIDTPGLGRQSLLSDALSHLGLIGIGAAVHLVLPPYFSAAEMNAIIERYRCGIAGSIVWSKLDEATGYASTMNACAKIHLPVSALSYGPGLKSTLCAASHSHLWKLLFKQQLPGDPGLPTNPSNLEHAMTRTLPLVLCVTSGKGGVGKTNMSVNLAYCLAQAGKRVVLLDADLGLANVDVLLGLTPHKTLFDLFHEGVELSDILFDTPYGFRILPATSGANEMLQLTTGQKLELLEAVDGLEDEVDYLVIDTGAGINDNVLYFNLAVQERLVVLTQEPTSLTDAYALIKVLKLRHGVDKFRVLVNMADDAASAKDVFARLHMACEHFLDGISLDFVGFIPRDPLVRKSVLSQTPFSVQPGPASDAVHAVAKTIQTWDVPVSLDGNIKFFWKKLLFQQ